MIERRVSTVLATINAPTHARLFHAGTDKVFAGSFYLEFHNFSKGYMILPFLDFKTVCFISVMKIFSLLFQFFHWQKLNWILAKLEIFSSKSQALNCPWKCSISLSSLVRKGKMPHAFSYQELFLSCTFLFLLFVRKTIWSSSQLQRYLPIKITGNEYLGAQTIWHWQCQVGIVNFRNRLIFYS